MGTNGIIKNDIIVQKKKNEHDLKNIGMIYKIMNMERTVMDEKNSLELFYQERVLNYLEIIEMGEHCISFNSSV